MLSVAASRQAAKFRVREHGTASFHPLICHMVDVAIVAGSLWDHCVPPGTQKLLAGALALNDEDARRWVAYLAGLHDLGKASRPFQAKDHNHSARLADSGVDAFTTAHDPGHGRVTAALLPALLESRGVPGRVAARLATVTGGHHGAFAQLEPGKAQGESIDEGASAVRAAWDGLRVELFRELARVLNIGVAPQTLASNSAVMVLAGLISVADWIGSNEDLFPYAPGAVPDLDAYADRSATQAALALKELNWLSYPAAREPRSFEELFGFPPRPLQSLTAGIRTTSDAPGLVIVEAPMGEGKTEAALHLVDHWNGCGFRGAYVGLPTQATANQLHSRVERFLRQRYPGDAVNLLLVHGGAGLLDGVEFLPAAIDDDEPRGAVAAGEWFLPRKRSLLAPYGVGTVDQSLMSVLQVKHGFVRLFGLAGKPVVIDEVHAYDTYMTGLLERLLEWLGAMGSPVVLLSATLPSVRRRALMQAYLSGRRNADRVDDALPDQAYPRITWVENDTLQTRSFPTSSPRSLAIERIVDSPEGVQGLLQRELANGGCAVVICNTVRRAQDMYRALSDAFTPGEELDLFHARFLHRDRYQREKRNLARFSRDAARRPQRFVLVATQVVEQSLDLDFDVMVSDMAPVDLLLQRSGRLHRHEGRDRHGHDSPVLHVLWPDDDDEALPAFDPGSAAVYDPHILLRTWWSLRDRDAIAIPEDVQLLIDTVYSDTEDSPAGAGSALSNRWSRTWSEMRKKQAQEQREAGDRRLRTPVGPAVAPVQLLPDPRAEDAPDLHPRLQALTRLVEPSADVVILPPGDPAITASRPPTRDEARRLLGQSVSVTTRGLVPHLLAYPVPPQWVETSWLRRHRLLVLADEPLHLGDYTVRYDERLGLLVEREGR